MGGTVYMGGIIALIFLKKIYPYKNNKIQKEERLYIDGTLPEHEKL